MPKAAHGRSISTSTLTRMSYDVTVQTTATPREAKELIIATVVQEAEREGIPLSEIERKMLYYSEVDWMPFDAAKLNSEFETECDTAEYEEKIPNLIRNFRLWAKNSDPELLASWNAAVYTIRNEDHYLLVLIDIADGSLSPLKTQSPDGSKKSFLRFIAIGIALGVVIILTAFVAMMVVARIQN